MGQIDNFTDAISLSDAPSLFFNAPVVLTFKNIKGFEICVIEENKKKSFFETEFKIKRGDMHFRICGESQFENEFIILNLIGNANAEVLLNFSSDDYVYKNVDFDNRLLNGISSLKQYYLQQSKSSCIEDLILKYKQIGITRFNFEFIREYFEFKDIAKKDES